MRVVVQRVLKASCTAVFDNGDKKITGSIDKGMMLLVGFTKDDDLDKINKMAKKIAGLRIFDDEEGRMNKSLKDIGGDILSISQFTLYANPYSGNRPSFVDALPGSEASPLYDKFNEILRNQYGYKVETGLFGAQMYLDVMCDGPVTIELEY